ncbi:MAG: arginine repressor [Candidatus Scalindua sp.]|nr:arginine repressor [Candidatus Scalindua sp.]
MDRIYRLDLIKEILNEYVLSNQDEIQAVLSKKGVHVTQATLSRDLKSLRVSRVTDSNGKTRYALQDATSSLYEKRELPDHLDGVISIEFSGQLGVIKTIPGFANAVAYYIDQVKIHEILGTIAGDDTILLIAKAEISGNHLAGILLNNFGGLSEKFK